jgi:hypothetical protein
MGGDGGVYRLCRRSALYWLHAANNSRNSVSVSGGKRSSHHHASCSKIRFADDRIRYHPGGEITQATHDNVFSFYEQND